MIRRAKYASRRKFPAEEKIRIVMEGIRAEVSVADLCRREGIHPTIYYKWLKDFLEAGKGAAAWRCENNDFKYFSIAVSDSAAPLYEEAS